MPGRVDAVIIGGGYTGLSAALTLARLGHRPLVLDAEAIGWGASSRNGGMVAAGLKPGAERLARRFGTERAAAIERDAAAALPFLEGLLAREGIDCAYARTGRFYAAGTSAALRALAGRAEAIASLTGAPVEVLTRARQSEALASPRYHGGLVVEAGGGLHPGRYARGLAAAAERAGARLQGGVRVRAITRQARGFRLETSAGPIAADAVLMATNGYTAGGPMPYLARRLIPLASYIIATEPIGVPAVSALMPGLRMIADTWRVLNYFRASPDGTRVLWGGRASFADATPAQAAPVLRAAMAATFPSLRDVGLTHAWRGNVAFTYDLLPHLGTHDGVHYAAGCQGSGVAMASWLGHQAGLRMAGGNEAFALADLPFPALPLYDGRPWFVPFVGACYRALDQFERATGRRW